MPAIWKFLSIAVEILFDDNPEQESEFEVAYERDVGRIKLWQIIQQLRQKTAVQ